MDGVPMTGVTPAEVAERSVLGALIKSPDMLREVREEINPTDFADLRLGSIYDGITGMIAAGEPVDLVTVWDKLASWDVRGIDITQLSAWADEVSSPISATYYARIVREAALQRDLVAVGRRLLEVREPGIALQDSIAALHRIRDRDVSARSARPRTLRELLDVPEADDAYHWAVPGLLERRDRLVLTGSEGGGKTTFLRQICVLAAAGIHPFRFSPIDPVRVLVVDAENSERQWRRAVREMTEQAALVGQVDPRDGVLLHCVPSQFDITRPQDLGMVHRLVEETKPDIVMIGPLYKLVPRAIKDDDDAAPVISALDSLRDHDVAMLIEAHAGHSTSARGERDLRPRGSAALLGWPEFGLGISRDKDIVNGRVSFTLTRWRGDRESGRAWPLKMHRRDKTNPGQMWPWAPAVTG